MLSRMGAQKTWREVTFSKLIRRAISAPNLSEVCGQKTTINGEMNRLSLSRTISSMAVGAPIEFVVGNPLQHFADVCHLHVEFESH